MEAKRSVNTVCKGTAVRGTEARRRGWGTRLGQKEDRDRPGQAWTTVPRGVNFWRRLGEGLKQRPTLASWGLFPACRCLHTGPYKFLMFFGINDQHLKMTRFDTQTQIPGFL